MKTLVGLYKLSQLVWSRRIRLARLGKPFFFEKMFAVQNQIRQNASELNEFISEVKEWTKDISKKDQELRENKRVITKQLPPVRGQKPEANVGKKEKLKSGDYRGWDSFDVVKVSLSSVKSQCFDGVLSRKKRWRKSINKRLSQKKKLSNSRLKFPTKTWKKHSLKRKKYRYISTSGLILMGV